MIKNTYTSNREYIEYFLKRLQVMRYRRRRLATIEDVSVNPKQHLCCFRPMLLNEAGHFFNNSLGLVSLAKRRGWDISFLSQLETSPSILEILPAKPVLPSYTSKKEWHAEEKSYFWEYFLHKHVTPVVRAGDWLYLAETSFACASAVMKWIQYLPVDRRPKVVLEFLSYYFTWRAASATFFQEKELCRSRFYLSEQSVKQSVICCTEVESWAEWLSAEFDFSFLCLPTTKHYDDFPSLDRKGTKGGTAKESFRVGMLGLMRHEKGDKLLREVISLCPTDWNVTFYIQGETEAETTFTQCPANQTRVRVLSKILSRETYVKTLTSMDIVLLPYETEAYAHRSSGIFCEAAAGGIPAIVPAGSWMARKIEANIATGLVFSPYSAEAILISLKRGIDELAALQEKAYSLAAAWRYHWSAEFFFDRVEVEFMKRKKMIN